MGAFSIRSPQATNECLFTWLNNYTSRGGLSSEPVGSVTRCVTLPNLHSVRCSQKSILTPSDRPGAESFSLAPVQWIQMTDVQRLPRGRHSHSRGADRFPDQCRPTECH